jgi:hypothetical protein
MKLKITKTIVGTLFGNNVDKEAHYKHLPNKQKKETSGSRL